MAAAAPPDLEAVYRVHTSWRVLALHPAAGPAAVNAEPSGASVCVHVTADAIMIDQPVATFATGIVHSVRARKAAPPSPAPIAWAPAPAKSFVHRGSRVVFDVVAATEDTVTDVLRIADELAAASAADHRCILLPLVDGAGRGEILPSHLTIGRALQAVQATGFKDLVIVGRILPDPLDGVDVEPIGVPNAVHLSMTGPAASIAKTLHAQHTLDVAEGARALVELHAHLMGMGPPELWVHAIMLGFLPRVHMYDKRAHAGQDDVITAAVAQANGHIQPGQRRDTFVPKEAVTEALAVALAEADKAAGTGSAAEEGSNLARKLRGMSKDERNAFLATNFTDDVVYDVKRLCEAMNIKPGPFARNQLVTTLTNACSTLNASDILREHVIFNAKDRTFALVKGMRNQALVDALHVPTVRAEEKQALKALMMNWFAMLGTDGEAPSKTEINCAFRGSFTPEFYPMRFVIRDCIVEQRVDALAILLNDVLCHYDRAGVRYVELSVSHSDLLPLDAKSTHVLQVLNDCTFASSLWKPKAARRPRVSAAREAEGIESEEEAATAASGAEEAETATIRRSLARPGDQKPWWRAHLGGVYGEKPRNMQCRFLMAFNRTKLKIPSKAFWSKIVDFAKGYGLDDALLQPDNYVDAELRTSFDSDALAMLTKVAEGCTAELGASVADQRKLSTRLERAAAFFCDARVLAKMYPSFLGGAKGKGAAAG